MDELVQWLGQQLDEDERLALAWPADQRDWSEYGHRRLDYASGAGEEVSAVNVKANAALGWERIYVKRDGIGLSRHVAEHDPARVLREIDAKRRILAECAYWHGKLAKEVVDPSPVPFPALGEVLDAVTPILRALALPYAARPGYRDEWRP